MNTDEKIALIHQVGEEIVTEEDLKKLLETEKEIITYDGFEPSGQMHIGSGILRAINVNKMTKTGIKFKMLVADWHAMANNKMGGDLEKIQTVGKYFIEVWKAAGMDLDNVEFVWASDLVKDSNYWLLVLKIAKTNSIKRFIRTAEIMGRQESEELTAAQILYSCMQTADIFTLGAKITQLGMDQRKVNMLAREIGPIVGYWKPVVVSHHILRGLQQRSISQDGWREEGASPTARNEMSTDGERRAVGSIQSKLDQTIALKMSKSNPDSAIFMTDTKEDIERKINKAFCPEGQTEDNPILEYCRYILFEKFDTMIIERPEKFGGSLTIPSYDELIKMYQEKQLHPQDLKQTVSKMLNELLEPVRDHFETNSHAKELLEKVKSYQITR